MATDNRIYGVGIIGAGWVSGEHVKAYASNPNAKVIGIYSRTAERAKAKLEECGVEGKVFSSLDELLASPDIDIVSICSPPSVHAEQVIAAASAGKHIVIEKPLAMNMEDVRKMQRRSGCGRFHGGQLRVALESHVRDHQEASGR